MSRQRRKSPGRRVGKNHFAGAEALAFGDLRFFKIDQAGFGTGDQQAIMRERVAQRTQAVAIEFRANENARRRKPARRAHPTARLVARRQ